MKILLQTYRLIEVWYELFMSAAKKHEMMVFEFCFLRKDASHDDESGPEFVASDVEGDVKQTVEHSPDMIRDKGVGVQGLTY